MKISNGQMKGLEQRAEEKFVSELMAFLRQTQPAAGPPVQEETLRGMVHAGLARARAHGIVDASSLHAFLTLMFEVAPNFDDYPMFRSVLDDPDIPAERRVGVLLQRATPEDYVKAAGLHDLDAWFPTEPLDPEDA